MFAAEVSTNDLVLIAEEALRISRSLPRGDFDDDEITVPASENSATTSMPDPSRRTCLSAELDFPETVPMTTTTRSRSEFEEKLGLWAHTCSVHRYQHLALHQIVTSTPSLANIPILARWVTNLKKNIVNQLPRTPLLQQDIHVVRVQQPTISTRDRKPTKAVRRRMFLFAVIQLITFLLQSLVFMKKIHIGMAHFVDRPTELWHSKAWASSIRTSSGEFATWSSSSESQEESLLPSHVISYRCENPDCSLCNSQPVAIYHLSRIVQVGKDYRAAATIPGQITLRVLRLLRLADSSPLERNTIQEKGTSWLESELVILEGQDIFLLPQSTTSRLQNIIFDYSFALPASMAKSRILSSEKLAVRRRLNMVTQAVRSLSLSHPIHGELELWQYGRTICSISSDSQTRSPCLSVASLTH